MWYFGGDSPRNRQKDSKASCVILDGEVVEGFTGGDGALKAFTGGDGALKAGLGEFWRDPKRLCPVGAEGVILPGTPCMWFGVAGIVVDGLPSFSVPLSQCCCMCVGGHTGWVGEFTNWVGELKRLAGADDCIQEIGDWPRECSWLWLGLSIIPGESCHPLGPTGWVTCWEKGRGGGQTSMTLGERDCQLDCFFVAVLLSINWSTLVTSG